jgi:hypothetical protein
MLQKTTLVAVDQKYHFGYNAYILAKQEYSMSYSVFAHNVNFGPRPGLEGPFHYPNGRVLYYDAQAGEYWDPLTDFYVDRDEVADLQQSILRHVGR